MCLAAGDACRVSAMIGCISLTALLATLSLANAVQAQECLTVKAGIAREIGQLTSDGGEKSYCVYALAGQTMKVTFKPVAHNLVTHAHLLSPFTHQVFTVPVGVIFH